MTSPAPLNYYEVMQLSPRADQETVDRVFRHLAKRYHPDNADSGDAERFAELMSAYRVLSNSEQRAEYDRSVGLAQETTVGPSVGQGVGSTELLADSRTRTGILSLLYQKRRNFSHEPGMGAMQLERILSCSEALMNFHMWYLRESGLIQRLENGHFAITAAGLNRIFEIGGPAHTGTNLLTEGDDASFADDDDADPHGPAGT